MLEALQHIDEKLLLFINSHHSTFWDEIMRNVTDRFFWIPFYVLLIAFLIWKLKKKSILLIVIIALQTLTADRISSGILKPQVKRLRPCHEKKFKSELRVIKGCGGSYGFVSSHAANTFALAVLMILIFRKEFKSIYLLLLWATLVSYSRIYLGVHYPGDILAGAILGSIIAILFYFLFRKIEVAKIFNKIQSSN